ncbi:RNI-like protein [Gonapodya prolifera JEL478]|uniref:RNI-like protein n=1 Tax=Gonapodya prolifera (strain JEL478) TaxID=1344416 RepID=A0A139AVI0_GONPJ|nr:RNI-like protein [Gonapodya prolifera JEL478]|eukprot:KXS20742.1 RNI-like protein [Gonapodya prolifera JEL478]
MSDPATDNDTPPPNAILSQDSSSSLPSTATSRDAGAVPSDLLDSLRSHPLFAAIPQRDQFVHDLAMKVHVRHVAPGDTVIREGERAAAMFFIVKGVVEVQSKDDEIVFAELGSGCFFGEIGVVFQVPRTASIVAQTRCLLAVVRADEFQTLTKDHPEIATLIRSVAESRYLSLKKQNEQRGRSMAIRVALLDQISGEFSERAGSPSTATLELPIITSPPSAPTPAPQQIELRVDVVDAEMATSEQGQDQEQEQEQEQDDADSVSSLASSAGGKSVGSLSNSGASETSSSGAGHHGAGSRPKTRVGGLIQMFSGKRRASVAVWADEKLQQLADAAVLRAGEAKHSALNGAREATPDETMEEAEAQVPLFGRLRLPPQVVAVVFGYLEFRTLMRMRGLSKSIDEFLRDGRNGLLRSMDLSAHPKKVDDQVLSNVVRVFGHMVESLCLRGCFYVTNKGLQHLNQAPNLINLDLGGCWDVTDAGLISIGVGCRSLEVLNLSNCRKITDEGVTFLMANASSLRSLSLSYCKNISAASFQDPTHWAELESLNLQRCTGIFDNAFESLRGYQLTLTELNLSDCSFLTDESVALIASGCTELEVLSLSFCCSMTDAMADHIAACKSLRVLDLSFCGNAVTDTVCLLLAGNLPFLERLSLRGCVQVTSTGVQALMDMARSLRVLNVSQCRGVTAETMQLVAQRYMPVPTGKTVLDMFGPIKMRRGGHGRSMTH